MPARRENSPGRSPPAVAETAFAAHPNNTFSSTTVHELRGILPGNRSVSAHPADRVSVFAATTRRPTKASHRLDSRPGEQAVFTGEAHGFRSSARVREGGSGTLVRDDSDATPVTDNRVAGVKSDPHPEKHVGIETEHIAFYQPTRLFPGARECAGANESHIVLVPDQENFTHGVHNAMEIVDPEGEFTSYPLTVVQKDHPEALLDWGLTSIPLTEIWPHPRGPQAWLDRLRQAYPTEIRDGEAFSELEDLFRGLSETQGLLGINEVTLKYVLNKLAMHGAPKPAAKILRMSDYSQAEDLVTQLLECCLDREANRLVIEPYVLAAEGIQALEAAGIRILHQVKTPETANDDDPPEKPRPFYPQQFVSVLDAAVRFGWQETAYWLGAEWSFFVHTENCKSCLLQQARPPPQ